MKKESKAERIQEALKSMDFYELAKITLEEEDNEN